MIDGVAFTWTFGRAVVTSEKGACGAETAHGVLPRKLAIFAVNAVIPFLVLPRCRRGTLSGANLNLDP